MLFYRCPPRPKLEFCRAITYNVFGLAEVGEFEVRMFKISTVFNRITNVQISTSAPILANPCYGSFSFCQNTNWS